MEDMTCPRCGSVLDTAIVNRINVHRCPEGHGVFLERADLGELADAEVEWHRNASAHHTQPLPRITPEMTVPPPAAVRARSYIETLFA